MKEKVSRRGVYYKIIRGDVRKPTLIFMHGAGSNHTIWLPYIDHFSEMGLRILAMDFRGHGRSPEKKIRRLKLKDHIEDICEIIRDEEISDFIAIGICFGSSIAIELSKIFEEKCKKIILVNLFDRKTINMPLSVELGIKVNVCFLSLMEMIGATKTKKKYKNYSNYPSQSNIYYVLSELASTNIFAYQKAASLLFDYKIDLRKVPSNTRILVITAEKDLLSSYKKIKMLCTIQNTNHNILNIAVRDAGHFISTRKPEMLISLIEGFCNA